MPGGCYSAADNDDAKTRREAGGDTAWNRWSKLTAVCLGVLCVVLLIVVIVLSNKDNNSPENGLQTSTSSPSKETEQLKEQRDKLQSFLKQGCKSAECKYFNFSFYVIINEQKSWNESRENCRNLGAGLVIINSREEQVFINNQRGGERAWIGLSRSVRENKWKWVDDTTLNTGFWASGQPNSKSGDADCAITGKTSDPVNNWGIDPCNEQYKWICEFSLKEIFD